MWNPGFTDILVIFRDIFSPSNYSIDLPAGGTFLVYIYKVLKVEVYPRSGSIHVRSWIWDSIPLFPNNKDSDDYNTHRTFIFETRAQFIGWLNYLSHIAQEKLKHFLERVFSDEANQIEWVDAFKALNKMDPKWVPPMKPNPTFSNKTSKEKFRNEVVHKLALSEMRGYACRYPYTYGRITVTAMIQFDHEKTRFTITPKLEVVQLRTPGNRPRISGSIVFGDPDFSAAHLYGTNIVDMLDQFERWVPLIACAAAYKLDT